MLQTLGNGQNGIFSHPFVAEILREVTFLRFSEYKIRFIWIKGHSAIRYNGNARENADELAKLAIKIPQRFP